MSITYPIVLLAAVLLAALLLSARMLLAHLAERRESIERIAREHREFKRAERLRRRAFIEQQVERVVSIVPMMISAATRGDALRAQLHDFVDSLGPEQFHALFASLTPEQQMRFVRLAESLGFGRTHAATGARDAANAAKEAASA
jgi:hypothetical protein